MTTSQFQAASGQAFAPQGIDVGSILNTVAQTTVQVLPHVLPLILGLLSSHPQIQQAARQGGAGSLAPQGFHIGINTPIGGIGFGTASSQPHVGNGAVAPQGFDLGSILNTVGQGALQVLPHVLPIVLGMLSSHPQVLQAARQGNGSLAPQSFGFGLNTPFGGLNFGVADSRPLLGANGGGIAPQGFDLSSILGTAGQAISHALPGILNAQGDWNAIARAVAGGVATAVLGQAGGQATVH